MNWEKPTYKEYEQAKIYERVRARWGLFIIIGAWITIIGLLVYTVNYVEELTTNPLNFCAEEFGLTCFCQNYDKGLTYNFNATEIVVQESHIRFGG